MVELEIAPRKDIMLQMLKTIFWHLTIASRSLLIGRLAQRLYLLVFCSGSLLILVVLRPNVQLTFPFLHLSHMLLEEHPGSSFSSYC